MLSKKKFIPFLAPAVFLFSGCGTPLEIKAVQKYAEFQTQSAELFPKISDDVYKTCIRQLDYIILNRETIDTDRGVREAVCNNPETGSIALKKAYTQTHNIIREYLGSLGALAANDLTNYDTEINAVGESIQRLPGLDSGQRQEAVSAGTALARILFTAFTNNYRRRELKEAVITADPSLTKLVVALDTSIKNHYVNGLLETERNSLDSYYKLLINPIFNQREGQGIAVRQYVTEVLKSNWSENQETIRLKQDLAASYLTLLKGIACDHASLKNLFLKTKTENAENLTCENTPGLESLFAKSSTIYPEDLVLVIESYSREVAILNDRADKVFTD
ncbi:hypothetical protein C1752_13121 [Acaryochloris thomasi RCC1774]|uniref:Lipoprotein n=1 Tax=Acaryochloris thomasi RCC1774 TaxID=1764569 RepID=A0A2W1JFA3_9CYAN|nr:hypothetical protein [Acaryochloris thomasi]PZD70395.1 hypothetical protein C1752_13121 [Acaryochloris thomasi RCC1774]